MSRSRTRASTRRRRAWSPPPNRARWRIALLFSVIAAGWACGVVRNSGRSASGEQSQPPALSRWGTPAVFTRAHPTVGAAVRDFFGIRPEVHQPLEFSHQIHLSKGARCTDCHIGVEKGPIAGIPSLSTCMICHSQIATDRPLIQRITAMSDKGLDLPWQRVYGYSPAAHVRFNHAPHIRAKVECSTCHGNMADQTVAQKVVDMQMAFCVNCHKARQASIDCLTCHF